GRELPRQRQLSLVTHVPHREGQPVGALDGRAGDEAPLQGSPPGERDAQVHLHPSFSLERVVGDPGETAPGADGSLVSLVGVQSRGQGEREECRGPHGAASRREKGASEVAVAPSDSWTSTCTRYAA